MEINISDYLNIFLDELNEQLQVLDDELLNLERDGSNLETIDTIFRAVHTLKGSSAAMGFMQMKELTHQMENVFDQFRNHELKVDTAVLTVIFQAVDYMKELHQAIIEGTIENADITPVVLQLKQIQQQTNQAPPSSDWIQLSDFEEKRSIDKSIQSLNPYQKEVIAQAHQNGCQVVTVYARIAHDMEMKTARAFILYNLCQSIGEVIASNPSIELIEKENAFQGELEFVVVTDENERTIYEQFNQISQFDSIEIGFITSDQMATEQYGEPEEVHLVKSEFKPEEKVQESKARVSQTVRVDVNRLEQLLNYVGELIIDNTRLQEVKNRLVGQFDDHADLRSLSDISNHLSRVIGELQEGMMKTRMMPIEQLFNRFPRMVRDIAESLNKEIEFVVQGKETELDRTLIEEISDPIIHLLRNSADHGIESPEERELLGKPRRGKLILKAAHQENQIVISIADDGSGIDPVKIKRRAIEKGFVTEEEAAVMTAKELVFLIFKSGMSTAESVTDLSGRGVGMDIVRAQIEKLNGLIDIDTSTGEGTVFTIKMPLTLAINRSLLVKLGLTIYAIPLVNVVETVRLNQEAIKTIQGQEVCVIRGTVFRVVRVDQMMNVQKHVGSLQQVKRTISVVIVGVADKRVCLVVDEMIGNQEIVIKPLGSYIGKVPYIAGGTILGDGNVALILDVASFVRDVGSKTLFGEIGEDTERKKISKELQFITFELGREQYALEIKQTKEIITVPVIAPIATSPPNVLGIINLRGSLVPVLDLKMHLNLPTQPISLQSKIIIIEIDQSTVGIMVDQVTEVLKLNQEDIESPPSQLVKLDTRVIRGIYKNNERIVIMLSMEEVLNLGEINQINREAILDEVNC